MPLISTRDLSRLPGVMQLRELLQSLATLDAILSPEWEYRYYSFNCRWKKNEEMGSMRNGQGDDFFALFNDQGCFLKGFVHDSPLAASSIDPREHYQQIPAEFTDCVAEPAFSTDSVTFCLWRATNAGQWSRNPVPLPAGDDPDGSEYLLSPLDGNPETYWQWAEAYYERDVALHAVKAIYQRQRLTPDLVKTLNPQVQWKDLKDDIREIGYPT